MKHVFILLVLFSFVAFASMTVDTLNTTRLTADSLFGDASKLSGTKAEKFWGGMSQYRFSVEINTHSSTPYLVIGNKPYPGDSMALHLSATGIGNAEEIKVIMPDSIALTAGSATTLQENYIYYHYNGGAPVLMVSATNLSHSNKGAVSDSLVGIGNFGLGTASVSDVVIGKYNEYRDVLNKFSMHAGHRMRIKTTYESDDGSDLLPTIRSKSLAVAGGLALQSRHVYCPPFDNRDGDKLISPVFADSAYAEWDSLSDFYEYSTGEAIGADQEFWIVLWESVSEDSTRSQLYINIQAGTNTYKKPKDCEQDKSHMIPKSIPAAFAGTGVLICGMILTNDGDSTCFFTDGTKFLNLRGESGDGGGSSGAPATDSTQITGWGFIPMWTSGDTLYFEVGDSTWSVVRDSIFITP